MMDPSFRENDKPDEDDNHSMRNYYVYIMASQRKGTLYIGVTNNLIKRVYQHQQDLVEGFTNTYQVHLLVHYEETSDVASAIQREK